MGSLKKKIAVEEEDNMHDQRFHRRRVESVDKDIY